MKLVFFFNYAPTGLAIESFYREGSLEAQAVFNLRFQFLEFEIILSLHDHYYLTCLAFVNRVCSRVSHNALFWNSQKSSVFDSIIFRFN
mgnify:CR=1 FL=1